MKKQNVFLTLVIIALTLGACKVPKEFLKDLKVIPSTLEMHGGNVKVTVEGDFPAKYFNKNMTLTVTPILRSKTTGKELRGTPKVYQGEKVKGNHPTIAYKTGGKYTQSAEFVYSDDFEVSELWFEAHAAVKKKEYTFEPVKAADGIIITPLLVSYEHGEVGTQLLPDKFQRVIEERQEAEIKFLIQQSIIRSSELKTQSVIDLTKRINDAQTTERLNIKGLEISSYASPDGGVELNEKLAAGREKETNKYINNELKKIKASVKIDGKFTAQDWEGFKALMEESDIQDKAVILRVLSMYEDPEKREAEIKNLSTAYKEIAETILPQLRRSKLLLAVEVIGKSDEEIAQLAADAPEDLTVEELLYAATLSEDWAYREDIYKKVTTSYPNDIRGFNNLGVAYFSQGNFVDADRQFTKALNINDKEVAANFNKAVIALYNGDLENAEIYLGNAGGIGDKLNFANGVLSIIKGDYAKAVQDFGTAKSNNAALAKILNKDYSGARKVLEGIEIPNGKTAYLLAITGARTNDVTLLTDNLSKAIKLDAAYKIKASKDAEFLGYAQDATFQNILK
ncbi:MAG: hypothetical protein LBS16_04140 [Prevotellaceae bacterium]|jgi:Tfp pilus assembly protein PilF|nr:hypothetical protein [Prevotellaceae bacterium]